MKNRWGRHWQVFLFKFFIFHNTYEATFFKSEKAFQTDEGGPGKQLTFFSYLIKFKKKYSVVLVMYSWVQYFCNST